MASEPWRNPRPAPDLEEVRHRFPPPPMIPAWLGAWWPAFLWSALIFTGSTDRFSSEQTGRFIVPLLHWLFPSLSPEAIDFLHHFVRKVAHFVEYFIFFLLVYRGIRGGRKDFHWAWGLAAWFIAAGYSLCDELHQSFTVSRGASLWDSLLDSTGALGGLMVIFLIGRFLRRAPST